MVIAVVFFMVLAALIAGTALSQRKVVRLVSALAAFGWACLMFNAASWVESLNYNAWYSSAASQMLNACIGGIEQGRQAAVLTEMRRMTNELEVTYEHRGKFKELAERAASSLTTMKAGSRRTQPSPFTGMNVRLCALPPPTAVADWGCPFIDASVDGGVVSVNERQFPEEVQWRVLRRLGETGDGRVALRIPSETPLAQVTPLIARLGAIGLTNVALCPRWELDPLPTQSKPAPR